MSIKFSFLFFVPAFFFSCKKEADLQFLPEPTIEFVSQSSDTIQEFSDSLTVTISYMDGDGDLGVNEPEEKNVFVKDLRNGLVYEYRLQQIAPSGSSVAVKGTFHLVLENIPLLGTAPESFGYSIYITDRAGHRSNTIATRVVTVTE